MPIASDRFGQLLSCAFALGLLGSGEGCAVAEEPRRRDVGAEPARVYVRQGIEGRVEGLADHFQAVQSPDGGHHMRRSGALMPTACEETAVRKAVEPSRQEACFSGTDQQARAEFAQHGEGKTGSGSCKSQGVLPVHAPAYGLGGLAVGEVLTALPERDQRQAPRRFAVVTDLRREVGKESMGRDDA